MLTALVIMSLAARLGRRVRRRLAALAAGGIAILAATFVAAAGVNGSDADLGIVRCDPAKVVGSENCMKCHAAETEVWRATPHCQTFETLHRTPEAKAIVDRLGLPSVKRNDECIQCHFNHQTVDGRVRITGGVTCESCHGAAKDWLESHADYGGAGMTREAETPEHRQERIERAIAAGMNNPTNLYLVARQCLACHTSPNERLVNVGGHPAGSPDFELVAWSQGMVRHNFVRTGGQANTPSDQNRLRLMFVVGVMADLEASLRATAAASEQATFGVASARRAALGKKRLYAISKVLDNVEVARAVEAATAVRLKLDNRAALVAAADVVGKAAFDVASTSDGSDLAAIDALVPTPDKYRGQPSR